MNIELTKSIIDHIYSSLMIIPSTFINFDKNKSILSKEFLLDKTLDLNDTVNVFHNKVWGCYTISADKKITMLVANCSLDSSVEEYALIVKLEDAPCYGLYLVTNESYSPDAMIACSLDEKSWIECSTYLQATFLAGMEQMKDMNLSWKKLPTYEEEFKTLKSFLEFHNSVYGDTNEG